MILKSLTSKISSFFLIEQINIVTMLIITVCVFLVLLIIGVRKSYKLKAENERLSKKSSNSDVEKDYEDFTEGHLY